MIGQNPNISHTDYVDVINAIITADSVKELVDRSHSRVSFKFGSYHQIPTLGSVEYDGLNRYFSKGYSEKTHTYLNREGHKPDPVMRYILATARPYWISKLLNGREMPDKECQSRLKLALDNIGDGLMVPLYGPFNKQGYIFVGFEKPREFFDEIFHWQLQAILQTLHVRYITLLNSLRSSIKLTNRETEVLEFICFGKTNPEIGTILGISTNTVAGHVKSIFLKFNATDRVTVALRAQTFTP